MTGILLLAQRYIAYHKAKTVIVVACITLSLYLPAAMQLLVGRFQQQLVERAQATPLVVGAKGSRFDLALHALYFDAEPPESITMQSVERIKESRLAVPIPLFVKFRARGFPIVGTTLDYFEQRRLTLGEGKPMVRLGDCLLGASVARQLEAQPNDRLLSDPENVFDIAGAYPLNMRVTGVLKESHSPDDDAVFVDLKTAWIIAGLGHGHEELATATDENVILEKTERKIVASAALMQFTEINDANIDSFHFHGDSSEFPVTAVLVFPPTKKAETLVMGRYFAPELTTQILKPRAVVDDLLEMVFRVKRFFDLAAVLLGTVTVLFLVLVVMLSLRLRRREMETMFKLGCSRFTIFWLQAAELAIVVAVSAVSASALCLATLRVGDYALKAWIL